MKEDSIDGIYDTLKQTAKISQSAGGIGLAIHNIRATGSYIGGTNGTSNGIIPMLRVFNDTARYVDQGGGKRKGAFAIYLEPWHADVFISSTCVKTMVKKKCVQGIYFMHSGFRPVHEKGGSRMATGALFCPNEAPGLLIVAALHLKHCINNTKKKARARKTIKAQELWFAILDAQIETGTPYLLYKDAANGKINQQNLGTIKSSTFVQKSWNTQLPMKWRFVTWLHWPCQGL